MVIAPFGFFIQKRKENRFQFRQQQKAVYRFLGTVFIFFPIRQLVHSPKRFTKPFTFVLQKE